MRAGNSCSFSCDQELQAGQLDVSATHSDNPDADTEPRLEIMVRYHRRIEGMYISLPVYGVTFRQSNLLVTAFRALGHILGAARDIDDGLSVESLLNFTEKAQFDTMGYVGYSCPPLYTHNFLKQCFGLWNTVISVMIDCSRNGVLKPDAVFFILRNMALMGLNMLQLYTEDTYEVENEPFFGYLRGRYSAKELAAIDDYAYDL